MAIQINSATPGNKVLDLALNVAVTLTDTGTATTRTWSLVDCPAPLAAPPTITDPTAAVATFTPTVDGTYTVVLERVNEPTQKLVLAVQSADGGALPSPGLSDTDFGENFAGSAVDGTNLLLDDYIRTTRALVLAVRTVQNAATSAATASTIAKRDANADCAFHSVTLGSTLSGVTGTFSGNVSAASGTFSGAVSAASGAFSGAVSANGLTSPSLGATADLDITAAAGTQQVIQTTGSGVNTIIGDFSGLTNTTLTLRAWTTVSVTGGTSYTLATPSLVWTDISGTVATWAFAHAGTTSLTLANTVTALTLGFADTSTSSATGASATLNAQNATGTTSTGGDVVLKAGSGTSTWGSVVLQSTTQRWKDSSGGAAFTWSLNSLGSCSAIISPSSTSFSLSFGNKTTTSGTGASLTIQAQNETGSTSTGGDLVLLSGTGTSTHGSVKIQVNSTNRIQANGTGLGFFNSAPIAQPARAGALTDSTGGSATSTLSAITAGASYSQTDMVNVKNALASIAAKYNTLEAKLSAAAGGLGLTA